MIARKVGRLANRLLLFAHFIGSAIEHGFQVMNPAFATYARYFPSIAHDLFCRFPQAGRTLSGGLVGREIFYRAILLAANSLHAFQRRGRDVGLIRLERSESIDLDSPSFLSFLGRHSTVFVQDWFFRSSVNCEKHGDLIRSFFTPWEHHLERARALLEPARRNGRFLVGVHIRQTDYVTFKGGRYLYSHQQYRDMMDQLLSVFADQQLAFLICSDAPVPAGVFAGLDVHYGNGHELEDLYALAACDRLVGPFSTYSKWASYYGKVPRLEMNGRSETITAESFCVASRLLHEQQELEPFELGQ